VEYEELSQGEDQDEEPAGLGPIGWIAIAVVCVLAGVVFLVLRDSGEPVADPQPQPTSSAPSQPLDPAKRLVIASTCAPVTDGRKALAVSFELQNVGTIDITLIEVQPVLPLPGLRARGPVTAGGTCERPGSQSPGGLITPGSKQLITMRFRLPPECPAPYPVQVWLRLRANQMVGTTTTPIYNDLGAVHFDTCPSEAPTSG
jgi:hypothetical protein